MAGRGPMPPGRTPGPAERGSSPVGQGRVLLQGLGGKRWQLLQVTPHHFIAEIEGAEDGVGPENSPSNKTTVPCRAQETPHLSPFNEKWWEEGVLSPYLFLHLFAKKKHTQHAESPELTNGCSAFSNPARVEGHRPRTSEQHGSGSRRVTGDPMGKDSRRSSSWPHCGLTGLHGWAT